MIRSASRIGLMRLSGQLDPNNTAAEESSVERDIKKMSVSSPSEAAAERRRIMQRQVSKTTEDIAESVYVLDVGGLQRLLKSVLVYLHL